MSPTLNWPSQVPGPNSTSLTQRNILKIYPNCLNHSWEHGKLGFPYQTGYLITSIPHGLITVIEIYISVHKVNKEENAPFVEITFTRQEENLWPHRVKYIIFMVTFSWPNPSYQEILSRAAHAPSHITVVSDEMFDSHNSREGSNSQYPVATHLVTPLYHLDPLN